MGLGGLELVLWLQEWRVTHCRRGSDGAQAALEHGAGPLLGHVTHVEGHVTHVEGHETHVGVQQRVADGYDYARQDRLGSLLCTIWT